MVSVGTPREKRPLDRPKLRREATIKMDLKAVGFDGVLD
jgi:hypothetical protein